MVVREGFRKKEQEFLSEQIIHYYYLLFISKNLLMQG